MRHFGVFLRPGFCRGACGLAGRVMATPVFSAVVVAALLLVSGHAFGKSVSIDGLTPAFHALLYKASVFIFTELRPAIYLLEFCGVIWGLREALKKNGSAAPLVAVIVIVAAIQVLPGWLQVDPASIGKAPKGIVEAEG